MSCVSAPGGKDDPHDLARFVAVQDGDYEAALAEIQAGRKRSHWLWYIFPQIDGLGFSEMSRRYAILIHPRRETNDGQSGGGSGIDWGC